MGKAFYFLNIAVLGASSLLLIPALVSAQSGAGWAQIAVGQALGGFTGVLVGLGWGVVGPALVANESPSAAAKEYFFSLIVRLSAFAVLAPVVAGATTLLVMGAQLPAVIAGLSTAVVGAGPGWFFIGRGQPRPWFLLDTLPRAAGNLAAVCALAASGDAVLALVLVFGGSLIGILLSSLYVWRDHEAGAVRLLSVSYVSGRLRRQAPAVYAALVGALYGFAPVVIVNSIAPVAVPVFALVDKLHKQVASGLSPFVQIAQRYVAHGERADWPARARRSSWMVGSIGFAFALIYAALLPIAVRVLTMGEIQLTFSEQILSAAVVLVAFIELFVGRALLPSLDLYRALARGGTVGAVVGLALLILLTPLYGAWAGLAALVLGSTAAIGVEFAAIWRRVRPVT